MTNAELIGALRYCKEFEVCNKDASAECPYEHHWTDGEDCQRLMLADAADALEAAEKRIAELEAQMPKEGEWIGIDGTMFSECSVCGERHYGCETPFCDMCGAKMKGENDERADC